MSTPRIKAIILCEGKEDRLVFEKISDLAGLSGLRFEDYGGKDSLGGFLKALKSRPDFVRREFETIALTRDADLSFDSAWQSLSDVSKNILETELMAPGVPVEAPAEFPQDPKYRVVAWVLPGPGQAGMLESLCLNSVSAQPEFECIESYFRCLIEKTGKADYHPKAKFHAWVVSHTDFKDKDYRMERAIKEDRFQWGHAAFDGLREFLSSLAT